MVILGEKGRGVMRAEVLSYHYLDKDPTLRKSTPDMNDFEGSEISSPPSPSLFPLPLFLAPFPQVKYIHQSVSIVVQHGKVCYVL